MNVKGVGLGLGYELMNKTMNMPQDKMQQAKQLTEDVVGGALNKMTQHQKNMIQVNAQMQVGMKEASSLINLFV